MATLLFPTGVLYVENSVRSLWFVIYTALGWPDFENKNTGHLSMTGIMGKKTKVEIVIHTWSVTKRKKTHRKLFFDHHHFLLLKKEIVLSNRQ
jgi:hypothetical protein